MKIFQYDKKIWNNDEVSLTWQFGIIKDKSLLWVNYEIPGSQYSAAGGLNVLVSLFSSSSLFGVSFLHHRFGLSFCIFAEYFKVWDD